MPNHNSEISKAWVRAGQAGFILQDDKRDQLLATFNDLDDPDAKAVFALRWLQLTEQSLEDSWQVYYELGNFIRESGAFGKSNVLQAALKDDDLEGYDSFQGYFEDNLKGSWADWSELDTLHRFVSEYAPEYLEKPLSQTRDYVRNKAKELSDSPLMTPEERAKKAVAIRELKRGNKKYESSTLYNNVDDNNGNKRGTSSDYLTRRIARDHPDILEDMKAGKYDSVRAAALDAGIVRKRVGIAVDPQLAANQILKHFPENEVVELIEILAKELE